MNRILIYPVVIVLLLAGCMQKENVSQLKTINKTLQFTNDIIRDDNNRIYEELLGKLHDMRTETEAAIWAPRATRIKRQADSINALIENLKGQLIEQSDSVKEPNAPVLKQLYETNGPGFQLLNKLMAYKDSLPVIVNPKAFTDNPAFWEISKTHIDQLWRVVPLLTDYRDSLSADERTKYMQKWLEENFAGNSSGMALVLLNKMENDVLTAARTFMDYCSIQTRILDEGELYYSFYAIATLSSSYVKSGQPIEVNAGVGSFSEASKPRITINGKEIKLNNEAVATYSFIPSGKPGKHSISVKFEHYKPDGSLVEITKDLKYIIAEEK